MTETPALRLERNAEEGNSENLAEEFTRATGQVNVLQATVDDLRKDVECARKHCPGCWHCRGEYWDKDEYDAEQAHLVVFAAAQAYAASVEAVRRHNLSREERALVAAVEDAEHADVQAPAGHHHHHRYLSTSCRHAITDGRPELHHDCQVTAPRHDGSTKVGAKCKHCPSVCVCPVCRHDQSTTSDGQTSREVDHG